MNTRRLGADDSQLGVDAVRLLKSRDGYPIPSAAYLVEFLSRPENVLIVAIEDGVPVGYIVAYLLDRVDRKQQMMFLYEIGVAESHRRRGVGKQLIGQLKASCREADVMKMWVPTARSNVAATRLYASTGAVPFADGDEVTFAYPRETFTTVSG